MAGNSKENLTIGTGPTLYTIPNFLCSYDYGVDTKNEGVANERGNANLRGGGVLFSVSNAV